MFRSVGGFRTPFLILLAEILLVVFSVNAKAWAANQREITTGSLSEKMNTLEKHLSRLRDPKGIQTEFTRHTRSVVLDTTETMSGILQTKKNAGVRLEFNSEDKLTLILSQRGFWMVQMIAGTRQVTQMNSPKQDQKSGWLSFLFESKPSWEDFVVSASESGIVALPKPSAKMKDVKELKFSFTEQDLKGIEIVDYLENTTRFEFGPPSKRALKSQLFYFKPQKDDIVTELKL